MKLPNAANWVNVKRNQGKVLVTPDSFQFNVSVKNEKKAWLHCNQRKNGCKVTATVDITKDMLVSIRGEHNHDSDLLKKLVADKVKVAVEEAVRNPTVAPRVVLGNLNDNILADPNTKEGGVGSLPNKKTICRTIQRKRQEVLDCPQILKALEEMIVRESLTKSSDGHDWMNI